MPFVPCLGYKTNPIKIHFAPSGAIKGLEEKNIGLFNYDSGELLAEHGKFV